MQVGHGPMRTGVTAVLPRGQDSLSNPVFAAWFSQNGNGEMTGTTWVEESGFLEGPVMITNTHSVGVVRDAVIQWRVAHAGADATGYLLVAAGGRRNLGWLAERHQRISRQARARRARPGRRPHGRSRRRQRRRRHRHDLQRVQGRHRHVRRAGSTAKDGGYTVGVLVQCNYGTRDNLRIAGIPVGREIPAPEPYAFMPSDIAERGSIIVVVATDAPLLAHQLKRLARRVTLGLGRNGSISGNGSGDIFIAFSTANSGAAAAEPRGRSEDAAERFLGPGVSRDRRSNRRSHRQRHGGRAGHDRGRRPPVIALPHSALRAVLKKYGRLAP